MPRLVPECHLSAIVARAQNDVIGVEGDLPWRLGSDLAHFKRVTLGKPCLMGRTTWESLPFPLPGRPNLVLTRQAGYCAKGAEVFTDLYAMMRAGFEYAGALGQSEVMIIGGAQLYRQCLPWLDRLYITDVAANINGDAVFPKLDMTSWSETQASQHPAGPKDDFAFTIRQLDRI